MQDNGYTPHPSNNKLRDVEEKYAENGHIFSLNKEIICSFDVCGGCEAHALMFNLQKGTGKPSERTDLDGVQTLQQMDRSVLKGNVDFIKCPMEFPHKGAVEA